VRDADRERIQERAREAAAGASERDRARDHLVVAEPAAEDDQAGQERQRLFRHPDRTAAEREDEDQQRQDQLGAPARATIAPIPASSAPVACSTPKVPPMRKM
jgi:hypothetical protein